MINTHNHTVLWYNPTQSHNNRSTVSGVACLAATNLVATLLLSLGAISGARRMHAQLLASVFRWPMATFDTTPTGRLINRFSADVFVVDVLLPEMFRIFLVVLFAVNARHMFCYL